MKAEPACLESIDYETTFSAHYLNFKRPGVDKKELGRVVVIHSWRKDCNLRTKLFLTLGGAKKVANAVMSPSYKYNLFDNTNHIIVWKNRPEEQVKWIHFIRNPLNKNWPVFGPEVPVFMNNIEAQALLLVCNKFPFVEYASGPLAYDHAPRISFLPNDLHWICQDLETGESSYK